MMCSEIWRKSFHRTEDFASGQDFIRKSRIVLQKSAVGIMFGYHIVRTFKFG